MKIEFAAAHPLTAAHLLTAITVLIGRPPAARRIVRWHDDGCAQTYVWWKEGEEGEEEIARVTVGEYLDGKRYVELAEGEHDPLTPSIRNLSKPHDMEQHPGL